MVAFCVEAPFRSCAAEIVMRILIGKSLSVLNTEIRLQPEPGMGQGGRGVGGLNIRKIRKMVRGKQGGGKRAIKEET